MKSILLIALLSVAQQAPAGKAEKSPKTDATIMIPGPIPTVDLLRAFVEHLGNTDAFPADGVKFVQEQYESRKSGDVASLLDESLAVLSPDFKAGLDALGADQMDAAAAKFSKLAESDDPYVAVNAAFFAAQAMVARDQLRDAHALLKGLFARHPLVTHYTTHADHLVFLLGFAQANMLEYESARQTFELFLSQFPSAPERFRTTAQQIVTELERREPERLGDVTDLLNYAKRELHLGRTDDDVVTKQKRAVSLLDRLIEEAEQQEQQGGGGGGKGGRSKRSSGKPRQSSSPRQQSELNQSTEDKKNLGRPNTAKPGEMWGKMPPKEREQILQALQKQFPSQYRDLTEQYYRQLSKDTPRP